MRPSHPRYVQLMELYHRQMTTALSAVHAPRGYTHDHPLQIGEHSYVGGEWIPANVVAQASPEEKQELHEGSAEAAQDDTDLEPKEETQLEDKEEEHRPPPGYGGHPWAGGTPEFDKAYNVPTEFIFSDPERFQFKQKVDKSGVTQELKEVTVWDQDAAGIILVWQDPKNRKTYTVNGHHRRELAGRLNVPTMIAKYVNARTAQEARAIGALVNMKEGRGTPMDVAKFLRDEHLSVEDLKKRGVSLSGKLAADGLALSRLNDRLFTAVARGQFPEETALAIARHLPDHNLQDQLANYLKKKEDTGKEFAPKVIESMAQEMAATPTHTTTEHTLFGDLESEDSLFGERNELKQAVRAELAKAVNDFKAVASERRAGVVGAAGNTLNVEENKKTAEKNAQTLAVFDKLVNSKGPISDALNQGAKAYAEAKGRSAKDAARASTVENVVAAVEKEVSSPHGGAENGGVPGGAPAAGGNAGSARADHGGGEDSQGNGLTQPTAPANFEGAPDGWWRTLPKARAAAIAIGINNKEHFKPGEWNDKDKIIAQVMKAQAGAGKPRGERAQSEPASVSQPEQEKPHAVENRIEPQNDQREHQDGNEGRQTPEDGGGDRAAEVKLPEGWEIKPASGEKGELGLFRAGKDTPVATAKTKEELAEKITMPKPKVTAENAPKSKGHVGFVGKSEYYRGADGRLYKAGMGSKISPKTGNRVGTLSSEEAMEAQRASEAKKVAQKSARPLASAGQPERKPHTAQPAVESPTEKPGAAKEEAYPGVPAEAQPKEPGFTGVTTDSLGRTYHWVDGVRVPGPQEPAAPKEPAAAEEAEEKPRATPSELKATIKEKYGVTPSVVQKGSLFENDLHYEASYGDTVGVGETSREALEDWIKNREKEEGAQPAEEEAKVNDELEAAGEGSDGSGLQPGEPLAGHAEAEPGAVLPGAGEGAGEGSGSVPEGDHLRSDVAGGEAGEPGHLERDGGEAGAGTVAPEAAGGIEPDEALRDRGGSGGSGGSNPETPAAQSLTEPPTPQNPTDLAAGNFRYNEDALNFEGIGLKTKFKQNVEAIKTLRAIELEGRETATPAEQEVMSKYVGWGAFPGIFKDWGDEGFDRDEKEQWKKEAAILRSLLSQDEWEKARGSILNAHYTNPDIVNLHWEIAERLGFTGGRFLETSAGIGYYLGMMPRGLASRTHASAVELDTITGKMLKLLYPSANVNIQGFEKHQIPDNFYDLIASNVPFGDYDVADPRYDKFKANIHDYFFLKSVDKVRPGGLVMHITSTGTMDKGDPTIREELAKQCDLVCAFRMPDTTHKENAGTEVVTDMIILRKRLPGEKPSGPAWMGTTDVPCPRSTSDPTGGAPITVNEYFAAHPENIIGELNRTGKFYGGDQKNVSLTDDADEKLAAIIDNLPRNIMSQRVQSKAFEASAMPAPGDVRPGGYTIKGGKLYRAEEGVLVEQPNISEKLLARIQGMMDIRDATRAVINAQTAGDDAGPAREELNKAYDAFVREHGFLSTPQNKRAFRGDPDGPLLLALEKWDNDTKIATKADMFTKDTIRKAAPVSHADTVSDALAASLNERGRLDIEHMAKLLGQDEEAVKKALVEQGIAFDDPDAGFTPADQYLSGNVRRKLTMARAAAAADPKFAPNVAALEKVQPEDIDHTEITARLGASWIPASDVAAFAAHVMKASPRDFDIQYVAQTGEWKVHYTSQGKRLKGSDTATTVWGVESEGRQVAGFLDVLRSALSGKSITVKKTVGEGEDAKEVVDRDATDACRAKVQELKDAFCGENGDGWLWEDDARRDRLHRFYNDNFNNIRHLEYNGSHLTFPGMNPAIKLHPHIPNFVWQVVTTGKGLAAHEVGTGKTYSMIASAMELRRLGLAKKPCIACLKANIEAITADCLKLYPGAKILSTVDMFSADKRKKTISQIATGDYDIVLMTHDNLNMLPMTPETQAKYIREELEDLRQAKEAAEKEAEEGDGGRRRGKGGKSQSVKALEKAVKNLEATLEKALATEKKDDAVYFEDLGVDSLFIDEAHAYKTLPVYTKMDRVKGVPTGRSQRATNMLMRARWLQEQNGGRGVIFATGTPVSNTMAEMYTMQRYLQPDMLKDRGIDKFDAWAKLFGDTRTKVEVSVTGEHKPTTRFAKFVNIPELMQIARQTFDVRRADDIRKKPGDVPPEARPKEADFTGTTTDKDGREYRWTNGTTPAIPRPTRRDKAIVAPQSERQAAFMKSLVERAEKIRQRSGPPQPGDDNMLNICTDGRKAALDLRLVDPRAPDDPNSKTNLAIENILKISKERPGQVQLIFSDVGVNPMKIKGGENSADDEDEDLDEPSDLEESAEGLRWYGDVIDKLVKGGIPREKIADFSKLSGQAKEDAQAALRRGDMLIGIGSTQKMGTGVNIQDRITAMHHLDVPWVPAAIEQRNGRGIRFGNQNKDVDVFSYVTEKSLDQMLWQIVANKAQFIEQVMTPGTTAPRTVENADTEQLSPEQVAAAASGDPRELEKANLEEDIKNLRRAQARHDKEQTKYRRTEEATLGRIQAYQKEADEKAADAKALADNPGFRFEIGDTVHTEREGVPEALEEARKEANESQRYDWQESDVGNYRGLELVVTGPKGGERFYLKTPSGMRYETTGTLQSIESIAHKIQTRYPEDALKDVRMAENDLASVRANLGKQFAKADELKAKTERVKQIDAELMPKKEEEGGHEGAAEPARAATATPERKKKSRYRTQSRAEERGERPVMPLSSALDPELSAEVRAEALKALREQFPLSGLGDYSLSTWKPELHPRGHEGNPGEFAAKGQGQSGAPDPISSIMNTDALPVHPTGEPLDEHTEEMAAEYQGDSSDVNELLRYPDNKMLMRPERAERAEEIISAMDNATQIHRITAPVALYRGVDRDAIHDITERLGIDLSSEQSVGKTFTDPAFVSTSTSENVAAQFGSRVLRITPEVGSCAFCYKAVGNDIHEREIVLPRECTFEVVRVTERATYLRQLDAGVHADKTRAESFSKSRRAFDDEARATSLSNWKPELHPRGHEGNPGQFEKKNKPRHLAAQTEERASEIGFTDRTYGDTEIGRRDYDDIEAAMTTEDRNDMDKYLAHCLEEKVNDAMMDFDPDITREAVAYDHRKFQNYGIEEEVADLIRQHTEYTEDEDRALEALDGSISRDSIAGDAVKEARDAIAEALGDEMPNKLREALNEYADKLDKELDEQFESDEEALREDRREHLREQYDPGEDRAEYLRDFWDDNQDLFTEPAPADTWYKDTEGDDALQFRTADGKEYLVNVVGRDQEIIGLPVREAMFSQDGSYKILGTGSAHEVFGKVTAAIAAYVKKKQPPLLTFSAAEPSRRRLYDKLVKNLAAAFPQYSALAVVNGDKRIYALVERDLRDDLEEAYRREAGQMEAAEEAGPVETLVLSAAGRWALSAATASTSRPRPV